MNGPIIPPLKLVNLKASQADVDIIEADVGNIKASLQQLEDIFPAEYDSTVVYNKGSLCMKDGVLKQCNSNNVTGAWNPSYWATVRLGNVATLSYTVVSEW